MQSRPSRGAWIEIHDAARLAAHVQSRPSRGAWIEIYAAPTYRSTQSSRPSRGAWIEMDKRVFPAPRARVAPLTGRVD